MKKKINTEGLAQRLALIQEKYSLTNDKFGEKLGVSDVSIGKYINKQAAPGTDVYQSFNESFPEISLEWLITGKGNMLVELNKYESFKTTSEYKENEKVDHNKIEDALIKSQEQLDRFLNLLENQQRMYDYQQKLAGNQQNIIEKLSNALDRVTQDSTASHTNTERQPQGDTHQIESRETERKVRIRPKIPDDAPH